MRKDRWLILFRLIFGDILYRKWSLPRRFRSAHFLRDGTGFCADDAFLNALMMWCQTATEKGGRIDILSGCYHRPNGHLREDTIEQREIIHLWLWRVVVTTSATEVTLYIEPLETGELWLHFLRFCGSTNHFGGLLTRQNSTTIRLCPPSSFWGGLITGATVAALPRGKSYEGKFWSFPSPPSKFLLDSGTAADDEKYSSRPHSLERD